MSLQVAIALCLVITTMVISIVGVTLQAKAKASGKPIRSLPSGLIIALLAIGVVILAAVVASLVILIPW